MQKTKKFLSDALVSLFPEKGYEDVSIQDTIDRANVGRSTYYAHCEDKEQLLLFGHDHMRNLSQREGEGQIDFRPFYLHLAERHELALKLLSGEQSEKLVTRSLCATLQRICRLYSASAVKDPEELPMQMIRAESAAAALVQMMTSWLQKGMPYPPERMAEESTSLMNQVLKMLPERPVSL